MNEFNLSQFEYRIQNLINLLVNRKSSMYFPASDILNTTNQSHHHFSVISLQCVLFLMEIYFQYISFTS